MAQFRVTLPLLLTATSVFLDAWVPCGRVAAAPSPVAPLPRQLTSGSEGVVKAFSFSPPGCRLEPEDFVPQKTFYVLECPLGAADITLQFSSPDCLRDSDGAPLAQPLHVQSSVGEAKLVEVLACPGAPGSTPAARCGTAPVSSARCRSYAVSVLRHGSSEASLSELVLAAGGGADVRLEPDFSPAVFAYTAKIPYGVSAELTAEASKGGFISLDSYEDARTHSVSTTMQGLAFGATDAAAAAAAPASKLVSLFVVSSDQTGRQRYVVQVDQLPNTDAQLAALRFNIGTLHPAVNPAVSRYRLEVPPGTTQVAISATASDKYGAVVSVNGATGRGYSSDLVYLSPGAPYAVTHIRIHAADRSTQSDYVLVVLTSGWSHLPTLASLDVPGCKGGLRPAFHMDLHMYRCLLRESAWNATVTPEAVVMPGGKQSHYKDESSSIFYQGKRWPSGHTLQTPLDDDGYATIVLGVRSFDGTKSANYTVAFEGYPKEQRQSPFWMPRTTVTTTTTRTTSTTVTTTTDWRFAPTPLPTRATKATTTVWSPAQSTTKQANAVATETGLRWKVPSAADVKALAVAWWSSVQSWWLHLDWSWTDWSRRPQWLRDAYWARVYERVRYIFLQVFEELSPLASEFILSSAVGSMCLALVGSEDTMAWTALLKQVQVVALTSKVVSSESLYGYLTARLAIFNFQPSLPNLNVCSGQDDGSGEVDCSSDDAGVRLLGSAGKRSDLSASAKDAGIAGHDDGIRRGETAEDWTGSDGLSAKQPHNVDSQLIGHLALALVYLPAAAGLLVCGLRRLSREENLGPGGLPGALGRPALHLRLLPVAVLLLDACLVGFTDAAAHFIHSHGALRVVLEGPCPADQPCTVPVGALGLLLLLYPVMFALLSFLQLARLRMAGRLKWSTQCRLFADPTSLAVSLRSPSFSVIGEARWRFAVLRWLFSPVELRCAVPLAGSDGGPVRVGDAERAPAALSSSLSPESWFLGDGDGAAEGGGGGRTSRADEGGPLLGEKSFLGPAGQGGGCWAGEERVGLLLWVERRSAALNVLRRQLSEAQENGTINDMRGVPILDRTGEPLSNLYQYCIYQFSWRPWMRRETEAIPGANPVFGWGRGNDPQERSGGVFAPWVPPADRIGGAERHAIDVWLARWHSDSELCERARAELKLLGWCRVEQDVEQEQAALLREMAIAVLQQTPMLDHRGFSNAETQEREGRFAAAVAECRRRGERLPWQAEVERLAPGEALGRIHGGLVDCSAPPPWASFAGDQAAFGVKRLHLRSRGAFGGSTSPASSGRAEARSSTALLSCRLSPQRLHLLGAWMPAFDFAIPCRNLRLPVREHWAPLFSSCSRPDAPAGHLFADALERIAAVLAVFAMQAQRDQQGAASVLLIWRGALYAWRLSSGGERQALHGASFAVCFLVWLSSRSESWLQIFLESCLLTGVSFLALLLGARALRRCCCPRSVDVPVYAAQPDLGNLPKPNYGIFEGTDATSDGAPLPVALVLPFLGFALHGECCPEPAALTDDRRFSACRKMLAVYEGLPGAGLSKPSLPLWLSEASRFERDVRQLLPVVTTRAQLAGREELRELMCTIHVVNHAGCPWSRLENDSFLSLFLPQGLDDVRIAGARETSSETTADEAWLERARLAPENPALIEHWRREVISWLYSEVGASESLEHTAWDKMLHGGGGGKGKRDAERLDEDSCVVPGLFSDDGLGAECLCHSRCWREGRVLHYVIESQELKSGLDWRPDPLGVHSAELLVRSDQTRPCLLRLAARSVVYRLRRGDGVEAGGIFAEWSEAPAKDFGDILEYEVPLFFLDHVEVNVAERRVSLHGRGGRDPRDVSALQTPSAVAPSMLPLTFIVSEEYAVIWDEVVRRNRMTSRLMQIEGYVGPVTEHRCLPGVLCRDGADGEQLWGNFWSYSGAWARHVYHGYGVLRDSRKNVVYDGEWQDGLRHGEGTLHFSQSAVKRSYAGQWAHDEFRGRGELRVAESSLPTLRVMNPLAIMRYRGRFEVSSRRAPVLPDLSRIEAERQDELVEAYFPMRMPGGLQGEGIGGIEGEEYDGDSGANPAMLQQSGQPPRDLALEFYGKDGNDLRHCGPDSECEILYTDGTRYAGACLAGAIPHAESAVMTEPNGLRYEGGFRDGIRAGGQGVITLPNGICFEGQFASPGGYREGSGVLTVPEAVAPDFGFLKYEGNYIAGLRHGAGRLETLGGSLYVGQFESNRRHGLGKMTEAGGRMYEGPWREDHPVAGEGVILYTHGFEYVGEVGDGATRNGEGKLNEGSSLIYSGQWQDDLPHGDGQLFLPGGLYEGQFARGKREGLGRFTYAIVSSEMERSYVGEWVRDRQHGTGTYIDEYGYTLADVDFENGRPTIPMRPPPRGLKEKLIGKRGPKSFLPLDAPPCPFDRWPMATDVCRTRGQLPAREPAAIRCIDEGSGFAHGRSRAAHLGLEGAQGMRWT